LNGTFPGKFIVPPIYAEDMYQPMIYGLASGGESLVVGEGEVEAAVLVRRPERRVNWRSTRICLESRMDIGFQGIDLKMPVFIGFQPLWGEKV